MQQEYKANCQRTWQRTTKAEQRGGQPRDSGKQHIQGSQCIHGIPTKRGQS